MSTAKHYLKELWNKLGYHGAWLPNTSIALGDVGLFVDGRFEPRTTLAALGISATVAPPGRMLDLCCASSGVTHTAVQLGAAVNPSGAARMRIEFGHDGALLFAAKSCQTSRLADVDSLGRRLAELEALGVWQREYHVVAELVTTGPATILVSNSATCMVNLFGAFPFGDIATLADVDARLSVEHASGLAISLVGQTNLTPLFGLRALRPRLLRQPNLVTRSATAARPTASGELVFEEVTG